MKVCPVAALISTFIGQCVRVQIILDTNHISLIFADYSRPNSAASGGWRGQEAPETEEELKRRQKRQLDMFYKSIDQTKETKLRVDLESRKHHDTLLPSQKSPLPHNRCGIVNNMKNNIFIIIIIFVSFFSQ